MNESAMNTAAQIRKSWVDCGSPIPCTIVVPEKMYKDVLSFKLPGVGVGEISLMYGDVVDIEIRQT